MEFLNSSVQCPLSSTAYYALTEFLRIPNAPTNEILSPSDNALSESEGDFGDFVVDTNTNKEASELQPPTKEASNTSVSKAMALSSQCISELLQAEQNQRFATDLLLVESNNTTELPLPTPMLPDHVTENLQHAMHEALMKVSGRVSHWLFSLLGCPREISRFGHKFGFHPKFVFWFA